jgi:hypothetical protein
MTLSAHVQGSGDFAYPDQDADKLRRQVVTDALGRVKNAFVRYRLAIDQYHAAKRAPEIHGKPDHRAVTKAVSAFSRALIDAEGIMFEALREAQVPVIHDRSEP